MRVLTAAPSPLLTWYKTVVILQPGASALAPHSAAAAAAAVSAAEAEPGSRGEQRSAEERTETSGWPRGGVGPPLTLN